MQQQDDDVLCTASQVLVYSWLGLQPNETNMANTSENKNTDDDPRSADAQQILATVWGRARDDYNM
jgi:hypothetical protein